MAAILIEIFIFIISMIVFLSLDSPNTGIFALVYIALAIASIRIITFINARREKKGLSSIRSLLPKDRPGISLFPSKKDENLYTKDRKINTHWKP